MKTKEYMSLGYLSAPSWYQYGPKETGTHTLAANNFILYIQTTREWSEYLTRMFIKVDRYVARLGSPILHQKMGFKVNLDRATGGVYTLNDMSHALYPKVTYLIKYVKIAYLREMKEELELDDHNVKDIRDYMLRHFLEWAWQERNRGIAQFLYLKNVREYEIPV